MIFAKAGSIWVAWVKEYLLKDKSFWYISIPVNSTWGWRKILKLRSYARGLIQHVLGDGSDIFLWHDYWHPSGPLILAYGAKIVPDSGLQLFAKVSEVVNGNFWNWPPARSPQLVQIQMALFDTLYPKSGKKDLVIWTASSSRVFDTSSAWHSLRAKQRKVPWHKLVWFSHAIPKHSFIGWLAILDRLTTRSRQKKWTSSIDDTCLFCSSGVETNDHLFFNCQFTKQVWQTVCSMAEIPLFCSWQGLLAWLGKSIRRKSVYCALIKLAWNATVYHVWRERNSRVYRQQFRSVSQIVNDILFDVRNKVLAFATPKSSSLLMSIAVQWGLVQVQKPPVQS
ncbi:hypothetical protein SLEP1_g47032 [Rubroshorea leprosula]|uniref:Reverse transcriptase zinc-binding domain-containing protein n=1 Tax=Rubroshorea leprosula TaxID=152421 RepID=A0AAV5LPA7_9ROSI|nr:hypothetical protein SLEP1_g47032 [Rubroshorea leprosula]